MSAWCVVGYASAETNAVASAVLSMTAAAAAAAGSVTIVDVDASGAVLATVHCAEADLPRLVAEREARDRPRWVWGDSAYWAPKLLAAGVRVERAHDLRLSHAILAGSERVRGNAAAAVARLRAGVRWEAEQADPAPHTQAATLFDLAPDDASQASGRRGPRAVPHGAAHAVAEFALQREVLAACAQEDGARLALLVAAESAGALIAAELRAAGLPWDAAAHRQLLEERLGPRPPVGAKPQAMIALAERVGEALGNPTLAIDSPPKLLRALRAAGLEVESTSKWELMQHEHPVVEPLLAYKQLARLMSANGWHWIDEWVRDDRYRPVYLPGAVVTGRWASNGGGALQIPRMLRPVIHADPGWTLVSADVSQLEPRVLAAMAGDARMAAAGRGRDLYAGLVDGGIVETRQEAKIAVLGAMYGSTAGDSGRLVPRLRKSFPQAMQLVDGAAAAGERGEAVATWLGRTSPVPSEDWREAQAYARQADADPAVAARARRAAREVGRFTRNFVVQGTAAEWALAWLADLRLRLTALPETTSLPAQASGPVFSRRAHLAFFLHDEVIVHTPVERAEEVVAAVRGAADAAGRLLFGASPVDFLLDVHVSERAEKG